MKITRYATIVCLLTLLTAPAGMLNAEDNPFVQLGESRVELTTADGVHLVGTLYEPEREGKMPGVVLLHMLSKNRDDWQEWARKLKAKSYVSLAIDLRGHGESTVTSQGKVRVSDVMSQPQFFNDMVKDVAAAVEYLKKNPKVDTSKIIIFGASIGANVAMNYVAENADVKAMVLLSPGLDYRGVTTEEAFKKCQAKDIPMFLMASEEDSFAAESSKRLAGDGSDDVKLIMAKEAGHGTEMISKHRVFDDDVLGWLGKILW